MKETEVVLLVEDSEEDVFFFKRALRKSGVPAEMLLASDGKAAVSILSDPEKRAKISLIFLDLKLPFLNGFEVLNWIQSQNFDPALRVVVLSGSSYKTDTVLAEELGAMDYVVKPITAEAILEHHSMLYVK